MKALQINAEVNLATGEVIAPGSILKIIEASANIGNPINGLIPCKIITKLFCSHGHYSNGKENISKSLISDFSTYFYNLTITEHDFENNNAQDLIINALKKALELIYPNHIEIIKLD